jgi:thioredoxin reductase
MNDVIVIGGGPAGLQAALTLGRMHHSVLLFDSGRYRNAAATEMHNMAGHDGWDPAAYRQAARADLARYDTVQVRDTAVDEVRREGELFRVFAGDDVHDAGRVILATGLRDTLPDIPGLDELWGREVAHCPYCHGHEFAGRDVAILAEGPTHQSALLARIVASSTVVSDAVAVRRSAGGITIETAHGEQREFAGAFIGPVTSAAAPFAEQLGATVLPSGSVAVDGMGRTDVPGLYAAGDGAHEAAMPGPRAAVLLAAASGLLAAIAIDADELAPATPS